jgi:eukaryotic-like serine/threonine-protein kinase
MRAVRGTFLRNYELLESLGVGGIGTVYRARDHRLQRDVAIKILNGRFADANALARFPEEARTLAAVRHENIAAFIEFGTADSMDFLVMEYCSGRTLAQLLAAGPLKEAVATGIAGPIASALEEAHQCGVFHSDLKPSNVILTTDGKIKLLDFGHANVIHAARLSTAAGKVHTLATLPYLAPETLMDGIIDRRSDVYGLGMLLFRMTSGCRPFPETSRFELAAAIVHMEPEFPAEIARDLSRPFREVVLKALSKNPSRRYPTASAMRMALNSLKPVTEE